MTYYPESIRKLIKNLSKLPGIGEKTADRLAMHILRAPRRETDHLVHSIMEVKEKIRLCAMCFSLSDAEFCNICRDRNRNSSILCVVEQPADMVAVERSGAFPGLYHILEGALSPMDGVGPDNIRIKELISRIAQGKIQEVVLATSTSIEGESTAAYIAERLGSYPVKVTRIASGVPMGGDLKYVDQVTLKTAMKGRHPI